MMSKLMHSTNKVSDKDNTVQVLVIPLVIEMETLLHDHVARIIYKMPTKSPHLF